MSRSQHEPDDLPPRETGYVRLTGHGTAQQAPVWRPHLVRTPGVEVPGPGMDVIRTPQTIEEFGGSVTRTLDAGAQLSLGESPVVLRPTEVFVLFELVNELGYVYAGTPWESWPFASPGCCITGASPRPERQRSLRRAAW